jgi:hypothetical protein
VEQAGEHQAIRVGERGCADLALQDEELVAQGEDLDVLVTVAHGQEPQKREGVRHSEIGQAQQHDRS